MPEQRAHLLLEPQRLARKLITHKLLVLCRITVVHKLLDPFKFLYSECEYNSAYFGNCRAKKIYYLKCVKFSYIRDG